MSSVLDKAGPAYWDTLWQGQPVPTPIDPRLPGLRNHVNRGFHELFARTFQGMPTRDLHLLEIGCGRSRWLPYFHREFGFHVAGLDYSATGCAQSRVILEKAEVPGRVIEADFFQPPADTLQAFDVVVSFGVVEHFADTAAALSSLAKFLKPGGLMITFVPNMAGWVGSLQKLVDRAIYEIHVPLDCEALRVGHERAGLTVQSCEHLLSINWGVVNTSGWKRQPFAGILRRMPAALSVPFWMLERIGLRLPPNRRTSPYIACLARCSW